VAKAVLVLTTADSEDLAKRLAETLLKRHQAAAVNIVPGMTSVFRWKGRVKRVPENLLLIKTLETRFEAVSATIRELHGYDVPSIFSLPAHKVEDAYMRWIVEAVTGKD
jgi:periplasmic divalent cation tolerance protein